MEAKAAETPEIRGRQNSLRHVKNSTEVLRQRSTKRAVKDSAGMDGTSGAREGRQFMVANVGNNGRIYLRYAQNVDTDLDEMTAVNRLLTCGCQTKRTACSAEHAIATLRLSANNPSKQCEIGGNPTTILSGSLARWGMVGYADIWNADTNAACQVGRPGDPNIEFTVPAARQAWSNAFVIHGRWPSGGPEIADGRLQNCDRSSKSSVQKRIAAHDRGAHSALPTGYPEIQCSRDCVSPQLRLHEGVDK